MEVHYMYDDNTNYYMDDDESYFENKKKDNKSTSQVETKNKQEIDPLQQKIDYVTDTSDYDSDEMVLITPEQATAEYNKQRIEKDAILTKNYADPILAKAISQVEARIGRKINYEEFDKMCKTYAAELANADARFKKQEPNPIDYKTYYDQLIQNKKVVPAYQVYADKLEQSKVDEIDTLLKNAQAANKGATLKVRAGSAINMHHDGDVVFEDTEMRREIKIDNKRDVELLHMKHRQAFLDKKYADEIKEESGVSSVHTNDGFE